MLRCLMAGLLLVVLCAAAPVPKYQYPAAPRGTVTDNYFGTTVADPYRWLENIDSPQTTAWVQQEGALTRSYLDAISARNAIKAHLTHILNYEKTSPPDHVRNQYFYTHNTGLQNQDVLYTMNGPHGVARVLIDPNTFSKDGTVALSDSSVSWNAKYIAYSTETAGSDWQTWRIRDIASGKDLSDRIDWSKFSNAAWLPDNSGFYYERYAQPKAGETYKTALYNQKIYLHKLGTPQSADSLFYARPDHPDWSLSASTTRDGRYVFVYLSSHDSINNRLYYVDLREPAETMHRLFDKNDAQYGVVDNVGPRVLLTTTLSAPNTRVVAVDLRHPATLSSVIPQSRYALSSVTTAGNRLFAQYLIDVHAAVKVYDYAGHFVRSVDLPGLGAASGFDGWPEDRHVYYSFASYTTPPVIFAYDIASGKSTVYRKPKIDFDPSQFETKEVFYPSKDGTRVPLWIAARKGVVLDGRNPTILYGYGGFDIAMNPHFSTVIATWLQMGGVYAVANIRGGSEYGEAWHSGGMLKNKQNVFDDFIAAAHYLIDQHYTSTPKLAINGGSNGGLLIGAAETQQPQLFGVAVPQVGVLDMLRFDKFTIGNAWISDYGCSTCSREQFQTLYAYSPYQNVKAGMQYPPTLIMTADHDDRVFPAHSFKFAAAMQAAQAGDAPILLRVESKLGHGHGASIHQTIDQYTDMYAFIAKNLNMELPADFK